jgi:hypothetical protein
MRRFLGLFTFALFGLIKGQSECNYIDNLAICSTVPGLTIERYQEYCPDSYKVCDLKNFDELNFLSKFSDLECTVSNTVQSQGTCSTCNRESFLGNLIHFGNCQPTRSLQAGTTVDIYETYISRTRLITSPNDIYSFSYNSTILNLNKTLLLQMSPSDIYYVPQIFQSSDTGKPYRLAVKIIFDDSTKTQYPTSEMSVRPSVPPTSEMSVRPSVPPTSEMSVRPSVPPTSEMSVRPSVPPTSEMSVRPSVPPTSEMSVRPSVPPMNDTSMRPSESSARPSLPPSARPTIPYGNYTFNTSSKPTTRPSYSVIPTFIQRESPIFSQQSNPITSDFSCEYRGLLMKEGDLIRSTEGICKCFQKQVTCEMQRCFQGNYVASLNTKCLGMPTVKQVACCKKQFLNCTSGQIYDKNTNLCIPKIRCINGNLTNENTCNCQQGFSGKHCEKSCRLDLCFNKGECIFEDNVFKTCSCDTGFTGQYCKDRLNSSLTCVNGYYENNMCKCFNGFMGRLCDIEIPCVYGQVNSDGRCICMPGYGGRICDMKMITNNIPSFIMSNKTCYRGVYQDTQCVCEPGWTGEKCEQSKCFMGRFNPINNTCICRPDWTGSNCDINCKEKCSWHGNLCILTNYGQCTCENNWSGEKCQNFKAQPNENTNVPLSSYDSLNFTFSGRFNMNVTSQICNTPNCLPVQFTVTNNSRTSLGRILQSDTVTFAYTVDENKTLSLQEVNNTFTINQVYTNGVLSASNLVDGSYVLVIGESSSNHQTSPTITTQTPDSKNNVSNNILGYALGGVGGGILFVIGIIVGTLIIKSNRKNNSSKIVKRPNIPNEMIENPVKFASSNNVEKQNLVESRNNFGPTNVRNNK